MGTTFSVTNLSLEKCVILSLFFLTLTILNFTCWILYIYILQAKKHVFSHYNAEYKICVYLYFSGDEACVFLSGYRQFSVPWGHVLSTDSEHLTNHRLQRTTLYRCEQCRSALPGHLLLFETESLRCSPMGDQSGRQTRT